MPARSLAALGATLFVVACTTDAPTTASLLPQAIGSPLAAKAPPPVPSGVLKVCLQAGAGLPASQTFTSIVTRAGITRSLTTTTGECATLEVPLQSTPLGKGSWRSTPTDVAQLLTGTGKLAVANTDLASSDVVAILSAAPNVQASSALVLNLTQQLIAAELNLLRGVPAPAQVTEAIGDANGALQITLGSQISISASLTNAEASALVNTLTAFNEGKTKLPAPPTSVDVDIAQAPTSNVEVQSIDCVPSTSCSGKDVVLGRVTATITSGNETQVTFTSRSLPILRVCVQPGIGAPTGTLLRVAANKLFEAAQEFDVRAGECHDMQAEELETYDVRGKRASGIAIGSITCDPPTRCSRSDDEPDEVRVIPPRGITTITFSIRTSLGTLRLCKVGNGLESGREFTISASIRGGSQSLPGEKTSATETLEVNGDCAENTMFEGEYIVSESGDFTGAALESIDCDPGSRCRGGDLEEGRFTFVTVVAGETTTATFTNRTTLGTMKVCVTQSAVPAGTPFGFSISPISVEAGPGEPFSASPTVPTGECREVTLKEGTYDVTQSLQADFPFESLACDPPSQCTIGIGARVTVRVAGGSTTEVRFTNSVNPTRAAPRRDVPVRSP